MNRTRRKAIKRDLSVELGRTPTVREIRKAKRVYVRARAGRAHGTNRREAA